MRIALIAHDKKKDDMIEFVKRYKDVFKEHELFATGTTGKLISEIVGLKVHRFLSGPLGGVQQIGGKVAEGEIDMIMFLRDPLTAQPHEPDVTALLRLCDVHCIPLATNVGSAEIFVQALRLRENKN
ncbi:MAG: methylglyoxal synthase [Clostridiales bacterium]|nr:methylglyoxal synthase [Clostridiales bacterium]